MCPTMAKTKFKTADSQPRLSKALIPDLALEEFEPATIYNEGIEDTYLGSTKFAWIGSGQCGGRIVKSFYDLGYHKVLALNTTHHDLDLLDIPDTQKFKMDIGEDGAGKDMKRGEQAVMQYQQDIMHQTAKLFGSNIDRIMICFGAGGGTGSGSALGLINLAKHYIRSIGCKDPGKHVGVVMTLPTRGEAKSPAVARNAFQIASELSQMAARNEISPLVIIDNDKISTMYPGLTVKAFWPTINSTVSGLYDIFNRLSFLPSEYTSFDPVDYNSILSAGGCCIMGLTKVNDLSDRYVISKAVKQNLEKTLLAGGFDLHSAKYAGCIVVGGKKIIEEVPGLQDNIDFAFDTLADIAGGATVHRGIYEDHKDSLRVYTIIGGLNQPSNRLEDLLR